MYLFVAVHSVAHVPRYIAVSSAPDSEGSNDYSLSPAALHPLRMRDFQPDQVRDCQEFAVWIESRCQRRRPDRSQSWETKTLANRSAQTRVLGFSSRSLPASDLTGKMPIPPSHSIASTSARKRWWLSARKALITLDTSSPGADVHELQSESSRPVGVF